jgi:S-DNA-T family DNA segregation ATPase FtsK/SpoIIIE
MKEKKKKKEDSEPRISTETRKGILAIAFFAVAVLLVLASFGKGGWLGENFYQVFTRLLGIGYFLLPLLGFIIGISHARLVEHEIKGLKTVGAIIFFISGLAAIDLISPGNGGLLGRLLSTPLLAYLDFYASLTIIIALLAIALFIILDIPVSVLTGVFSAFFRGIGGFFRGLFGKKNSEEVATIKLATIEEADEEESADDDSDTDEETTVETTPVKKQAPVEEKTSVPTGGFVINHFINAPYNPPPLNLLERDRGTPGVGDIKANANIIKRTLQNFGIVVEMDEISIGPSVTRYALKPAEGVKLSRIVALQNDLSLALAAHPLRIEAPIPGKSLVGIEIPNSTKSVVGLGTLLANDDFQGSDKALLVALGKGISGKSHFANVAKMPHLLIAGATGSGKSVTIHTLITSLLYRNSPENMRMIMIDPKRVELTLYNNIPHLLTPVITDAKKAIMALRWAAKEMDRRYDILQERTVRDIDSYHKSVLTPAIDKWKKEGAEESDVEKLPETMPYIVIVLDELADIMQTFPRELEAAIVRLAQMSRAVGIHLVLSTQRPSVNVITGLIKANVPARIGLQVASQIDSRTILDMAGAEKLLGAGDMLYLSGEMSQPQRIQSAFISENEVKKVVKYIIENNREIVPNEIGIGEKDQVTVANGSILSMSLSGGDEDVDDELYEEAKQAVIEAGKASTSYLQRKLRVGYARAARLIDILEEKGVIGPGDGAKPREVLGASTPTETPEEEPTE